MDRRFFVLTAAGEQGPFTAEDLRREVQAGTIAPGDVLRTAMGKASGTVGELLGPQARVSGRMRAANPTAGGMGADRRGEPRAHAPAARRTASDGRLHSESQGAPQRKKPRSRPWILPVVAIAVVAMTATIAAVSTSSSVRSTQVGGPATTLPVVSIQVVGKFELRWDEPKSGTVEIHSSQPVSQDTTIRLQWSGTGLSGLAPQSDRVIMPAGSDRTVIAVTPATNTPKAWERREAVVTLLPDPTYQLGSKFFDSLAIQGANALPGIAYEPFAYESASKLTSVSGGSGWPGPWQGDNATLVEGTVVIPQAAPDFGRSVRIASVSQRQALARRLPKRVDSGEFWLSFRACLQREDGYHDGCWAGIGLREGSDLRLFIGKPYAFSHWGLELHTEPMDSWRKGDGQDVFPPVFLVNQVILANGRSSYRQWRNPQPGLQAPAVPSVEVLNAPGFTFDTMELIASDNCSVQIDELRLGYTFAEVAPMTGLK